MKDAKGHGSNAHGGGVPDINHPVYKTAQKPRGYNSPVNPLNADYSTSGQMLRARMGDRSKDDHVHAGDDHVRLSQAMQAEHGNLVAHERSKLTGDPGPLISGIVSDKFSERGKSRLRDLAVGSSQHTSAAFAHYAAAGMRLPTARARYQNLKG